MEEIKTTFVTETLRHEMNVKKKMSRLMYVVI